MMKYAFGLVLAAALSIAGCGGDSCSGDGCSGTGGSAGSSSGAGGSGGGDGTGGSAGSSSGAGGSGGGDGTGGSAGSPSGAGGSGGGDGTGGAPGAGGTGGVITDIELRVEDYIVGLQRPWDIGWLPNGTVLVTERPGNLKIFVDGPDASPTTIAIPNVRSTGGEGGLLGLVVDPGFSDNGYVYVCMASDAGSGTDVRVRRLTMSRPDGDSIEASTDIVTGIPHNDGARGRHSGCRLVFGPDGYLWVGTGDAAIGTTPQDDDSLGGKVLRVDRNGNAAPGNPGGRLWFSKGHRNIQGMAFRSDGIGMSAEHGPNRDDEVNLLVEGNFGWDPVPGYTESVPMTDTEKFPDAIEAAWSTGSPTLALCGATFIEGRIWGDWDGRLAVATLKASHLHVYDVDAEGNITNDERVIEGEGRLRAVNQGPDGLVYITTDRRSDGDRVLRVTPVPVD